MIRNGLLQSIGLQSGPNVHPIIESPQVSDGQTPKGQSSCPERGIGEVRTTFAAATPDVGGGGYRAAPPHDQICMN